MKLTTVGVDIAKSVLQLHYVDRGNGRDREQTGQACGVSRALCEPVAVPDRDGSLWRLAALGAEAHGDGPSGEADARRSS